MIFPEFSSYHTYLGKQRELGPSAQVPGSAISDAEHYQHWFDVVRSRRVADLNGDTEEEYKSLVMALFSQRLLQGGSNNSI